jgi:general secretion pathway protein C
MKRISIVLGFVLFIVLCATGSFWVMQFMKSEPRKISAPPMSKPVANVESVAGLFGGALAVNSNYQLKGIVLANPQNQSEAIIVVDGKPSQAFTVNSEISPGVKVTEVRSGYVLIMDNGVSKRVELPQDAKPGIQNVDNSGMRSPLPTAATRPSQDNTFAARNSRGRGIRQLNEPPANPANPANSTPPAPPAAADGSNPDANGNVNPPRNQ